MEEDTLATVVIDPVVMTSTGTQTASTATKKQLDALAYGRALNHERKKKYIEFERLQNEAMINAALHPLAVTPSRAVTTAPKASISFV